MNSGIQRNCMPAADKRKKAAVSFLPSGYYKISSPIRQIRIYQRKTSPWGDWGGIHSFLVRRMSRLPRWQTAPDWSGSSGRPAKLLGMVSKSFSFLLPFSSHDLHSPATRNLPCQIQQIKTSHTNFRYFSAHDRHVSYVRPGQRSYLKKEWIKE